MYNKSQWVVGRKYKYVGGEDFFDNQEFFTVGNLYEMVEDVDWYGDDTWFPPDSSFIGNDGNPWHQKLKLFEVIE